MIRRMRAALILLLLLPAIAAAQAPPSKTLERAIKLYDKADYYSSTIEARKVVDGGAGDSPENVHRAKFFLAKSFYQIKFYVPSLVMLQKIVEERGPYRGAALKWVAAVARVIPERAVYPALRLVQATELDEPSLSSVREELRGLHARAMAKPAEPDYASLTREALGCTQADIEQTRALIAKLLSLDNAEIQQATNAQTPESRTLDHVLRGVITSSDPRWLAEITAELELLRRADKAWQTTQVAAEILEELTVHQSLALDDRGAQIHRALPLVDAELAKATGEVITQTPLARCQAASAPPAIADGPRPVSPGQHGCGCGASGGSSIGSGGGGILVALLAFALLRSSSRAAARTRSPRA